jgi:DNA-binding transcriptional regulator YdaS (Cro superfamily)
MRNPDIARAIEIAGSQRRLAEKTGLAQQMISKLLNGERGISAETAVAIEKATNGAIHRSRLRPDLWDKPTSRRRSAHRSLERVAS